MDPISFLGLLSAAGSIAGAIALTIKNLSDIRSQYTDADLRIKLLIAELSAVKSALTQIHDWVHYLDETHKQVDIVNGLNISLEGCQLAVDALAEEVRNLLGDASPSSRLSPGFRLRARYAWSESAMTEHQDRLHRQVAILQLLLQAAQSPRPEQTKLLQDPKSRRIIQSVADDTVTLRATKSAANSQAGPPTIASHENSIIDGKVFDWDDEIVNADTYRRALNYARSKSYLVEKIEKRDVDQDTQSQVETEGSFDQTSPIENHGQKRRQKPLPYEPTVASEPVEVYGHRSRYIPRLPSMSESAVGRKGFLPSRVKSPETEKKSFWSSVSAKPKSRTKTVTIEQNVVPSSTSASTTPGSRRGRRGFEDRFHTSIDFTSQDGLTAPPIVRAAQAGSVIEVEMLLDQRTNIEARHAKSGRNALAVASHCGNEDVVRLLLQHRAHVNERDVSLMTPLHLAASRGHCGVVELLLEEGASVDQKGPNDETPLRIASDCGHIEAAELLLRHRAKVNARDQKQLTALHMAAKRGDEAIVDLLVSHGAHVEAKDGDFMAALHHASENGHDGVVNLLLNKKADIEAPGKASKTPLACASSTGQIQVVELLLKKKASLKSKGDGDMTALHWASFDGHVEIVDILLQKRAPINTPNKDGRTPLHLAVMAEHFAVAELLIRKNANIEAADRYMLRPLHHACGESCPEIIQLLLGSGAMTEAQDSSGQRPIHNAVSRGSAVVVDILIQRGVDMEARNATGDRPLVLASSLGHVGIVRALLERGSPLKSQFLKKPSHEDSPLCLAAKHGHTAVVAELLQRGASVLQKDEFNWQPLRYAAYHGHPAVVELLLKHGAKVSGSPSSGWGFDMTAHRIGFAQDIANEAERKGQVLRLLTNAEAKEEQQRAQQRLIDESVPLASLNINPNEPTEMDDGQDSDGESIQDVAAYKDHRSSPVFDHTDTASLDPPRGKEPPSMPAAPGKPQRNSNWLTRKLSLDSFRGNGASQQEHETVLSKISTFSPLELPPDIFEMEANV